MVVLIFDTNGGLCNQFYDIINGINFCLKYNIFFTFRYCSFRNDNLTSWIEQPFEKLFDLNLFNDYKLYINYNNIRGDLTDDNCYNLNDKRPARMIFNENNILDQFINLNKKYIVLKQFNALYKFKNFIDKTVHTRIFPSNHLMEKYIKIQNKLITEPYNFIHYRYETDFTTHFKVTIKSLDHLLSSINFKNNNLKIYIATSNIKNLINLNDCKYKNLIYKNDDELMELNFEERAFIDYMFGLNSVECYGHKKSSFSCMINNIKKTNNYYT